MPRAEPLPAKALVIEDLHSVLPTALASASGVVVRTEPGSLRSDLQQKLRIANGLHSAMVYVMALSGQLTTAACAEASSPILPYLAQLYLRDVRHLAAELHCAPSALQPVYAEWMSRLQHAHFGLSTFFVAQNATQKLGIRLIPS